MSKTWRREKERNSRPSPANLPLPFVCLSHQQQLPSPDKMLSRSMSSLAASHRKPWSSASRIPAASSQSSALRTCSIARVATPAARIDVDAAERARLESSDAFAELVAINNNNKQSVNRRQKVRHRLHITQLLIHCCQQQWQLQPAPAQFTNTDRCCCASSSLCSALCSRRTCLSGRTPPLQTASLAARSATTQWSTTAGRCR